MLISEDNQVETKLASQTVTVTHQEKDGAAARLVPLMEYDQDGYKGQLALQADSIYTEAAEKSSYSYPVTDTKEYTGMERNDPYGIPKTAVKNGVTLELADIDWTPMGEGSYEVAQIIKITDTDWEYILDRPDENWLTLVTCVSGEPSNRLMVFSLD